MKRTLLINSSWEPLTFVDSRRIVSLLMREKVEVISLWNGDVLIPQLNQELPATVRLKKWVKRSVKMPKFRRRVVFTRDNWECQYCQHKLSAREATIDHVHPRSQGGKTDWKNCVTCCRPCNRWKADHTPEKAGMKLVRPVQNPNVLHFWDLKNGQLAWHPDWDQIIPRGEA